MPGTYVKPPFQYTSFSRLELFCKCSEMYRLKYVERLHTPQPFRLALVKGTLVHSVLQELLDPETETQLHEGELALALHLPAWLEELNLDFDSATVIDLARTMGQLLYRASSRCQQDPIRNNDGSVPNDVLKYPPANWNKVFRESGIAPAKLHFDNQAALKNPGFVEHSFTFLVGEIYSLTQYLQLPGWLESTLYAEYPISTTTENKILFPGEHDLYFNAYIDWIFKTTQGQVVLADHKTSKKKPLPQDVLYHPQLNLYAALYEQTFGYWPDILAIHHVPSGELVMAAVDPQVVLETVKHFMSVQGQIKQQSYRKRHPAEFSSEFGAEAFSSSPCLQRDWRSGVIKESCPYLNHCWPTYVSTLEAAGEALPGLVAAESD